MQKNNLLEDLNPYSLKLMLLREGAQVASKTVEYCYNNRKDFWDTLKFNFNSLPNNGDSKEFIDPGNLDVKVYTSLMKIAARYNHNSAMIRRNLNLPKLCMYDNSPLQCKWTYEYVCNYGSRKYYSTNKVSEGVLMRPLSNQEHEAYERIVLS